MAGVYFSGYADDFFLYYMKKFYKAKANAEIAALEKVGNTQAEGFLKGAFTCPQFNHLPNHANN